MEMSKYMKFNNAVANNKKKIKRVYIVIAIILAVLLLLTLGGYLYWHHMYNKLNYVPASHSEKIESSIPDDDDTEELGDKLNEEESEKLDKETEDHLKSKAIPIKYDKDVYNVLLIGVDDRSNSTKCRSDTMILASINKKTKKIVLTSFLRDIYIAIPQCGSNRLNAANAFGGPELLLDTLEQNFRVKIDRYAMVNFYSFMDIIDMLGGVTVNVTDSEKNVANKYVHELNHLLNKPTDDGLITETGDLHLTGKQALAYARNRYTGSDFDRTDRQREVLTNVFGEIKDLNVYRLNKLLNEMLDKVTTNIPEGEMFSLLLDATQLKKYTVEQVRIPLRNAYKSVTIRHMSVLDIDINAAINEIDKKIYGD